MKTHMINSDCRATKIPGRQPWTTLACCLVLGAGVLALAGCAQYAAITQPKPFRPATTVVGAERTAITSELGAPKGTLEQTNSLTDTYTYIDGGGKNKVASKSTRVVLYTVGDLCTICLDQILTWPLEAYTFDGTEHTVTVEYIKGADGYWRAQVIQDVPAGKKPKPTTPSEKAANPSGSTAIKP